MKKGKNLDTEQLLIQLVENQNVPNDITNPILANDLNISNHTINYLQKFQFQLFISKFSFTTICMHLHQCTTRMCMTILLNICVDFIPALQASYQVLATDYKYWTVEYDCQDGPFGRHSKHAP